MVHHGAPPAMFHDTLCELPRAQVVDGVYINHLDVPYCPMSCEGLNQWGMGVPSCHDLLF